jgi:hypothetical protein
MTKYLMEWMDSLNAKMKYASFCFILGGLDVWEKTCEYWRNTGLEPDSLYSNVVDMLLIFWTNYLTVPKFRKMKLYWVWEKAESWISTVGAQQRLFFSLEVKEVQLYKHFPSCFYPSTPGRGLQCRHKSVVDEAEIEFDFFPPWVDIKGSVS